MPTLSFILHCQAEAWDFVLCNSLVWLAADETPCGRALAAHAAHVFCAVAAAAYKVLKDHCLCLCNVLCVLCFCLSVFSSFHFSLSAIIYI